MQEVIIDIDHSLSNYTSISIEHNVWLARNKFDDVVRQKIVEALNDCNKDNLEDVTSSSHEDAERYRKLSDRMDELRDILYEYENRFGNKPAFDLIRQSLDWLEGDVLQIDFESYLNND